MIGKSVKNQMSFSGSNKSILTQGGRDEFYHPIRSIHENFFFPVNSDFVDQETSSDFHFPILIPSKKSVDPSRKYISRAEVDTLLGLQDQNGVEIDTKNKLDTPTPVNRSQTPSPARRSLFDGFINIFSVNPPPAKQEESVLVVNDTNIVVASSQPEVKAIAEIIQEEKLRDQPKIKTGVTFHDDVISQGQDVNQRKMDGVVSEMWKIPDNAIAGPSSQEKFPSIIVSEPVQGAMSSVQKVTTNQGNQEASMEKVIVKM